jgi:2,6-dihydroxypseudooxynicotine hydrolase
VLIMVPGLDSAKEELEAYELPFLARGMATLLVDGPGQGEAEYDLPIRGDYEAPVRSMVDWVAGRADLDAGRIGLWDVSLGGYYAPRAAAYEKRIAACIGLAGPYDWGAVWMRFPGSPARRSACAAISQRRRRPSVTPRRSRSGMPPAGSSARSAS